MVLVAESWLNSAASFFSNAPFVGWISMFCSLTSPLFHYISASQFGHSPSLVDQTDWLFLLFKHQATCNSSSQNLKSAKRQRTNEDNSWWLKLAFFTNPLTSGYPHIPIELWKMWTFGDQVMKRSQMSFNIFNLGEFLSFLEFRMAFSNGIVQPQPPHSDQSRFFTSSKLLTSRFSTICALRMVWPISTFRHGDWTNQFLHPTDPTLENPELTNTLTIQQRVFNHQNCGFQHQTCEVHHGDLTRHDCKNWTVHRCM